MQTAPDPDLLLRPINWQGMQTTLRIAGVTPDRAALGTIAAGVRRRDRTEQAGPKLPFARPPVRLLLWAQNMGASCAANWLPETGR